MSAEVKDAVAHALKSGYRHVDAAFVYGNENEVGDGLKEAFSCGIKREDIFVTSKLWNTYHRKPEECLDEGLKRLGLDYVDLYLIHWPVPMNPNGNHPLFPKHPDGSRDLDTELSHVQVWKNMEALLKTGKTKAIGVSNYSKKFLEELLADCQVVPAANQIENRECHGPFDAWSLTLIRTRSLSPATRDLKFVRREGHTCRSIQPPR